MDRDIKELQDRLAQLEASVRKDRPSRRKHLGAIVGFVVGVAAAAYAAPVPHLFQAGQPALASQINENFASVSSSYAFNALAGSQQVLATQTGTVDVTFLTGGETDPSGVFNPTTGVFTAPVAAQYFFSFESLINLGNGVSDGVIVGLSINGQSVFNVNKGAFTVLEPGLMNNESVSVSGVVSLNAGDTVQVRLQGKDGSAFSLNYFNFSGFKL